MQQVAEIKIGCENSIRLLFAEEVIEMDNEYRDSMRLLFADIENL